MKDIKDPFASSRWRKSLQEEIGISVEAAMDADSLKQGQDENEFEAK